MTARAYAIVRWRCFASWWALDEMGRRPARPPGQRWERTAEYARRATEALRERAELLREEDNR